VRTLTFEYRESGARSVAKRDKQVRQSIQRTGRTAQRNSGEVQRWLERSRKAIQLVAAASLAAVGAIASASPTMRAQLGGVRAAFTLFAEEIISNVLPAGTNLGSMAVDLARRFKGLPGPIKRVISIATVVGSVLLTVAGMVGTLITVLSPVAGALGSVWSALVAVAAAVKGAIAVIALLTGVAASTVAAVAALIAIVVALGVALIFNIGGARDKTVKFLTDIWRGGKRLLGKLWDWTKSAASGIYNALVTWLTSAKNRALALAGLLWKGVQNRLGKLRARVSQIVAAIRDTIVEKITAAKDRVLKLLSIGRDMAEKGKAWIAGLARGVKDRAGELVSSFRDMAERAANALKNKFNAIVPDSLHIPRISVDLPDALGGGVSAGPWSIDIPQLDTGGRIVSDGIAMVHAGERIMPRAQVRERGPQPTGGDTVTVDTVNIMVSGTGDARTDGRNIAREFERELSDRGA